MTVIAAFKFKEDMWVAADRETSKWADYQRSDYLNNSKLIRFTHGIVATCGYRSFKHTLTAFKKQNSEAAESSFETEEDVFAFFQAFHIYMKENFELKSPDDTAKFSDNSFMVVTPKHIYAVASDLSICIYDNIYAMGSGGHLMFGGIHCLSQVLDDPREIIHRAYEVPIKFGYGCGGEVEIINVTQTLKDEALKEAALKEKKEKPPKNKKNKSVKKQKASAPLKMVASL